MFLLITSIILEMLNMYTILSVLLSMKIYLRNFCIYFFNFIRIHSMYIFHFMKKSFYLIL